MDWSALGPYGALVGGLVAGAFGLPVPEELVLLGAGAAVHAGYASYVPMLVVALLAVFATDLIVFGLGRWLGPAALDRRPARWLLPAARRARIEAIVDRHGAKLIFFARFVPGLRAPIFLVLGAHRLAVRRFLIFDALAVCLSAPLMVTLGHAASSSIQVIAAHVADAGRAIALAAVALGVTAIAIVALRARRGAPGRTPRSPPRPHH